MPSLQHSNNDGMWDPSHPIMIPAQVRWSTIFGVRGSRSPFFTILGIPGFGSFWSTILGIPGSGSLLSAIFGIPGSGSLLSAMFVIPGSGSFISAIFGIHDLSLVNQNLCKKSAKFKNQFTTFVGRKNSSVIRNPLKSDSVHVVYSPF